MPRTWRHIALSSGLLEFGVDAVRDLVQLVAGEHAVADRVRVSSHLLGATMLKRDDS